MPVRSTMTFSSFTVHNYCLQTFRGVFLVIVLFAGMALAARAQQLFPSHSIAQSSVLNQEEQDSDHVDSATVEPLEETQFSQHYEQTRLQLLQRLVAAADVGSNPSPKDTTEATTDSYTEGDLHIAKGVRNSLFGFAKISIGPFPIGLFIDFHGLFNEIS